MIEYIAVVKKKKNEINPSLRNDRFEECFTKFIRFDIICANHQMLFPNKFLLQEKKIAVEYMFPLPQARKNGCCKKSLLPKMFDGSV